MPSVPPLSVAPSEPVVVLVLDGYNCLPVIPRVSNRIRLTTTLIELHNL